MKEIYVVSILTEDGCEYLKYEGENKDIAVKIYEEFKGRQNKSKISLYKKIIIEEIDKRRKISF